MVDDLKYTYITVEQAAERALKYMAGVVAPLHPNEINARYMDMRSKGEFYISQIGGPPLSIEDWKECELKRWQETQ